MQMSRLNVHQNYKKEYRRAWQYIIISLVLISASIVFSFHVRGIHVYIQGTHSALTCVIFYTSRFIQKFMTLAIPISFIILLNNLYKRLSSINACLRYHWSFLVNKLIHNLAQKSFFGSLIFFVFDFNRNCFLNRQLIFERIVSKQRPDANNMIRFFGRQYSLLTDTTDKISAFYSIQVKFLT